MHSDFRGPGRGRSVLPQTATAPICITTQRSDTGPYLSLRPGNPYDLTEPVVGGVRTAMQITLRSWFHSSSIGEK